MIVKEWINNAWQLVSVTKVSNYGRVSVEYYEPKV